MLLIINAGAIMADEASGIISDTGFGTFMIDDKGATRLFNMAIFKSQYEPNTWRPLKGDTINVTYDAQKKRGNTIVLAARKVTLIKAGPDTVSNLESPVTVTLVEAGVSGIKARLPKGQVVKFDFKRGNDTERVPSRWVIIPDEKAVITFHVQVNRWSNTIVFVADKIEKVSGSVVLAAEKVSLDKAGPDMPRQTVSSGTPDHDNISARLKKLKDLIDSGAITEEEYQVQRKVLVEKL